MAKSRKSDETEVSLGDDTKGDTSEATVDAQNMNDPETEESERAFRSDAEPTEGDEESPELLVESEVVSDEWRDTQDEDLQDEAVETEEIEEIAAGTPPSDMEPSRGGNFWPALIGGVIAAAVGFIVGRADQIDPYLPAYLRHQSVDLAPIEALAQQVSAQTRENSDRLDALEAIKPVAAGPDLGPDLDSLKLSLSELSARLSEVEARPIAPEPSERSADSAALDRLEATLASQKDEIDKLTATVEDARSEAASEAQKILARAALTRVVTAVDNGAPFAPALGDLEETGIVEVPADLVTAAGTGVPTLSQLQDSFPEAARAALAAARSDPASSDGLTGFLRRQLGARSVTPREGSDPDAVLSRVEAALKDGRLTDALAETDTLPDTARAAMSAWLEDAEARVAAQKAAESLAQSLTTN